MENSTSTNKNETIITDSYYDYRKDQLRLLDKKINKSRNTIFIVAGITLVGGLLQLAVTRSFSYDEALFIVIIAAVFAGLGFFAKYQPFGALVIALIIYVGMWLVTIMIDPSYLVKGILIKALIIYYLASGIPHANEAEKIKKELKTLQ